MTRVICKDELASDFRNGEDEEDVENQDEGYEHKDMTYQW